MYLDRQKDQHNNIGRGAVQRRAEDKTKVRGRGEKDNQFLFQGWQPKYPPKKTQKNPPKKTQVGFFGFF